MGNIRGWAGGDMNNAAEEHFTQRRGAFQKELLARMRGLGMTAVLSAFSGHGPGPPGALKPPQRSPL